MPDLPLPSRTPTRAEIVAESDAIAGEYGLPRDLMLALCIAEAGEGLQSFERWHRWTTEARTYIEQGNVDGLRDILQRCAAVPTNDISFGPAHQTWRWSPEYNGNPYDLDAILKFRAQYIENPGHALRVAAGQIKRYWTTYGPDKLETLCRYNKPAVAGADNPNRPNYQRALIRAGAEPTTIINDGNGSGPVAVTYENFRDPGHALFAKMPKGVVLHGSRSGSTTNTLMQEYKGTANWELNNPDGYAWHVTVGPGIVGLHLTPKEWGQHDPWASQEYLAVEFAQPTVNNAIVDAQVDAFVDWFQTRVLPVWPSLPLHFPSHPEVDLEYGHNQGKSDAFPVGDPRMDDLRARIMARLEGGQVPVVVPDAPVYTYVLGFADLAARLGAGAVGAPVENEHDAERGGHPIRHQLTTMGELVYWKNENRAEFYRAA